MKLTHQLDEVDMLIGNMFKKNAILGEQGAAAKLSLAEIHFISAVAEYSPANGVLLAKQLGLTKGGVSKIAARLIMKKMINAEKMVTNKKSQYYSLTDSGLRVCRIHAKLHDIAKLAVFNSMDSYGSEELQIFNSVLNSVLAAITESSSALCAGCGGDLDEIQ